MINLARMILILTLLSSSLTLVGSGRAQTSANKETQSGSVAKTDETKAFKEADLVEAQRRSFAISLLMSLADEARSYRDLALRARVLARSADTLWEADSDAARMQFRRAWEAAEKADAEEGTTTQRNAGFTGMVIASGRTSGGDMRSEVLTLAAGRDRVLGRRVFGKTD